MSKKKSKESADTSSPPKEAQEAPDIAKGLGDKKKQEVPLEKPPDGQMFIKVYSPFKIYFDGLGTSISAANDTGAFDILAGHHRFLTLLSTCEIQIRVEQGEGENIKIDRGIMYVKQDRVTVFLDV